MDCQLPNAHSMYNCIFQGEIVRQVRRQLEQKCANTATVRLLFHKDLKVLVDDCHSQQNSSPTSNSAYMQPQTKHQYINF